MVSAGALTGVLAIIPPEEEPHWRGGILFDDAVRRRVRLSSPEGRATARAIGNWPYYTAGLLPLLVDPLVALTLGRDRTAALNLELIGLEAFSYAGLLSFVSTRISERERPDISECRRHHPDGPECERDTEAFWSGHTTIVFTSAGLVCANHRAMALWGGAVADAAACALASSAAAVTGVSRLMADRHYATDVLVGAGIGFGFGYGIPTLLHYARSTSGLDVAVLPLPMGDGMALSVSGLL